MGLSSKQHRKDLLEDDSPVDNRMTKKTGSPAKKMKLCPPGKKGKACRDERKMNKDYKAATKQVMEAHNKGTKKTGSPVKKSKARIAQDYARNAEVDGDTSAGRYEERQAVKEAASKKGPVRKDGSMKGDQSATHRDYAGYKGTDKGYHGHTGASHGDQSATHRDYEGHGHLSSVHKVLKHSHKH